MAKKKLQTVVIWTKSRPWLVACGDLVSRDGDTVTLRNARMACYYDASTRGVLGLASTGPGSSSRVSGACEAVTIGGVEGVAVASEAAIAAWRSQPWR